ncbi:hypothetical protein FRC08_013973 [Ceratobasidium sp. 394]|nr:hypothetical protein FRC08_013973 [Ceratobasidium sp. 394]
MEGVFASGSKTTTSVSSAVQGAGAGLSTFTRSLVGPSVLDNLRKSEECPIDDLLQVFLKACQADAEPVASSSGPMPHTSEQPSMQRPPSSMETDNLPQGDDRHGDHGLPNSDSDKTIKGSDLLENYLTPVLEICEDEKLRELLDVL